MTPGAVAEFEAEIATMERALAEKKENLQIIRKLEAKGFRVTRAVETVPGPRRARPIRHAAAPAKPRAKKRKVTKTPDLFAPSRVTWSDVMRAVLARQSAGMSYDKLREAIIQDAPAINQSRGFKGFYQSIKRLTDSGELVKSSGLIFSAKLAESMKRSGRPLPVRVTPRGGAGSILLGILEDHPGGLTGPELKAKVAEHPDAPASVTGHPQYIYNVLGTLQERRAVEKNDGRYRLTKFAHGASTSVRGAAAVH